MRRAMFLTLGLTVAAFLASCSGGAGGGQQITVTINPTSTVVTVNQSMSFTDKITGTTNTAVDWGGKSVVGGPATTATINAFGGYTSPAQPPRPATGTA